MRRRQVFFLCLCVASASRFATAQTPQREVKIAVKGYDVVAYFTLGKPTKGDPAVSQVWDGARYLFSSEEHRRLFAGNPDKYAPQFNGHCSTALALGAKIEADPEYWVLSDGRLFLFSGAAGPDMLRNDPSIASVAQENWARLQ
jgi:YHS domain-containing protein